MRDRDAMVAHVAAIISVGESIEFSQGTKKQTSYLAGLVDRAEQIVDEVVRRGDDRPESTDG